MIIAAAAYPPQWHANWADLARTTEAWVARAADQGADLAVFPEYAGIGTALLGTQPNPDLPFVQIMADRAEDWAALHLELAQRHDMILLAGSLCARTDRGYVNRAYLATPAGLSHQDKIIPTPYERGTMRLTGGTGLRLFDTALGRIGVLICYDSEFPLLARALVEAGADMILVPSCTELPAGATRVRQSARARAIESQCLIVQAPLVGDVPGCDIVDQNTGRAAFLCPPDHGLPPTGIIAQGPPDTPGWTFADVDPAAIAAPRSMGQVGNHAHWPEQTAASGPPQIIGLDPSRPDRRPAQDDQSVSRLT